MERTKGSRHSGLDFNLSHPEYSQDSSVSIVTELRSGQPRNFFFSIPGSCKRLSPSSNRPDRLCGPPSPYSVDIGSSFPRC
jgi:hypothetical protein